MVLEASSHPLRAPGSKAESRPWPREEEPGRGGERLRDEFRRYRRDLGVDWVSGRWTGRGGRGLQLKGTGMEGQGKEKAMEEVVDVFD